MDPRVFISISLQNFSFRSKITAMNTITPSFSKSILQIISERYSCRTYSGKPINAEIQSQLVNFVHNLPPGPFHSEPHFHLVASTDEDSETLSDLGTYGFIKDAPGYIIGATKDGGKNLEDFGYLMEAIILCATDLGLGTCWLGGTFTRSTFADRINASETDIIPAVTAVGYPASIPRNLDAHIRRTAGSDFRLPWEKLFFNRTTLTPLSPDQAGEYAKPLEMVRLGPSASNKQPWRIVKGEDGWHFFLRRTPGYLDQVFTKLIRIEDLQRVDMGIAMCHFEFTARVLGLKGSWQIQENPSCQLDSEDEYLVTWVC